MSRIKGHLRYYLLSSKSDNMFALIMVGIVLTINLLGVFVDKEQVKAGGYVSSFFTAFVFYFLAIGVNNVFETFPYLMSFNSTRREFYLGLLSKYAIVSGTFSGFITILFVLESLVYRVLGLVHLPYLSLWGRDVAGPLILVHVFIVYMFMLSLYNLFGLFLIRFRIKQFFWICVGLSACGYVVNMFYPYFQTTLVKWFFAIADLYLHYPMLPLLFWISLISLLIYAIGWLFIRRAEVKVFNTGA